MRRRTLVRMTHRADSGRANTMVWSCPLSLKLKLKLIGPCQTGNWRICNLLLSNGADVLAVNAEGDLPIDLVSDTKVRS